MTAAANIARSFLRSDSVVMDSADVSDWLAVMRATRLPVRGPVSRWVFHGFSDNGDPRTTFVSGTGRPIDGEVRFHLDVYAA